MICFLIVCLIPFKALALLAAIFFVADFSDAMVSLTDLSSSTRMERKAGGIWPAGAMGEDTMET